MLIDSDQVAPTMNLQSSTNAPIGRGSQSASTEARRSGSSPTRPLDRGTMEQVARHAADARALNRDRSYV
jgi:hypothetical protein